MERLDLEWQSIENDVLRVTLPDGTEPEIFFKLAVENGFQIRHLAPTRYSLEDVFAQAVGEEC